jgi:hypothetical protein
VQRNLRLSMFVHKRRRRRPGATIPITLEAGFQAVEKRCRVHGRHMEASNERGVVGGGWWVVGRRCYLEQGGLHSEMKVDDARIGARALSTWDVGSGKRAQSGNDLHWGYFGLCLFGATCPFVGSPPRLVAPRS